MFENFSEMMLELFATSLWETIVMVGISGVVGGLIGIPLGVFLRLTDRGGVLENSPLNKTVGWLVNAVRSTPFIILLVLLIPFSRFVVGTAALDSADRIIYNKTTGVLSLIVGSAYAFSFIVAKEQIPQAVGSLMLGITDNKYVLLLIINIVFLVLGMFIDTSTIMLVFIPMVLPLVKALGIDLTHFGVMIVLNMMIGLTTPPFGVLLFIVSGITKVPLQEIIKETLPLIGVLIVVLFLITYIPGIVLFLPELFLK